MIKFAVKGQIIFVCFLLLVSGVFAQESTSTESASAESVPAESTPVESAPVEQAEKPAEAQTAVIDTLAESQKVTLDFKEADIRNVLKIISYKAGVNIIATPEVMGNVSIRLVDVPWEKALDAILKTYGFAYEKQGNIILVAPIEKLTAMKQQEVELAQVQPTLTEVFTLKYLDALDAKKALDTQLSPRGKITVLEMTGQGGWEFGTTEMAKRVRTKQEVMARSKVLIISDIAPALDKIKDVIKEIDVMPQQVLIETRIMEVSRDKLKDIGIDWGTGSTGASSANITAIATGPRTALGTHSIGGLTFSPSVFGPKESTLTAAEAGLKFVFQKLSGTQFQIILHALEEDVHTNTLSAPRIMTLNNQEATILIGTKYPILKSEVNTDSAGETVSVTLDYYQDIGIQLNVVPQVGANNYINMIVHPAISTISTTDSAISSAKYPVIDIREAETRVLMRDGETVVIGGLLKDVKGKETIGIPFLSKIPFLGPLFRRDTVDTQKMDLIIFITTNIVKEGELTPEEIAKLEERYNPPLEKEKAVKAKKKEE